MLHCLQTQQDQQKLRTLLAGMKSEQVSVVFRHGKRQFPYNPWIDLCISLGLPETLCVCKGLSENPHIRGVEVSGVPLCLLSEVQCLLMKSPSCHSITVNRKTLHQVEPCTAPKLYAVIHGVGHICMCVHLCCLLSTDTTESCPPL